MSPTDPRQDSPSPAQPADHSGCATFDGFFHCATGFSPYEWQKLLACDGFPKVLNVPTGLGHVRSDEQPSKR